MTYKELCDSVYSHIQSKSIREYYLNEIKDSINPNILLYMLSHGLYSLEYKLDDFRTWMEIVDSSRIVADSSIIIDKFRTIYDDCHNTNTAIYSGHLYNPQDDYNQTLEIDTISFYGKSFEDIFHDIKQYEQEVITNSYFSEEFQAGYIDKVYIDNSTRSFIRYYFNKIAGEYVLTYADIYENNAPISTHYDESYYFDRSLRYPFNDNDQIVLKTPLMIEPVYGTFEDGTDLCGVYYAWMNINNSDDMIDIALTSIGMFSGYLYTDCVYRLEDYNNGNK